MNEQEIVLSTVQYYALEGNYSHIRSSLLGLLKRFGSDPLLLFWRGFSMVLEGRLIDGIRELTNLQDTPDLLLAVPMLLKYAHRKCETVDSDAIKKLDDLMKSNKSSLTNKDYYYAAIVMWLIEKHDKARDYIDKILKAKPQDKEALSIRGWIDLTSNKEPLVKKSVKYFEEACNLSSVESPAPLDALFGKARYQFIRYSYSQSLDLINTLSAQYSDFIPLYCEKMNVQIAQLDWEGAVETAKRCTLIDSSCVQAASVLALEKCVNNGDMNQGAQLLGKVLVLLDQYEPKSHSLYYTISQTFSRIANGHQLLLQQTRELMDRAISICPSNYEYIIELGYQHMMSGQTEQALKCFKMGISVNQTSIDASMGIVHCLLKKGQVKLGSQQLEFLTEIAKSKEKTAELHYLNALLLKMKGSGDSEQVIQLLNETVSAHFSVVKGYPLGMKYLFLINPYFIMKVAKFMMEYAPSDPSSLSDSSSALLQSVSKLLDPLVMSVPGLLYIQLILAKVKYLSRDFPGALAVSQACIDGSYRIAEAHLLQAVTHLYQNNISACSLSLEAALSCSFEVQQYALYHIVKGRQELASGNLKEARKSFETALSLRSSSDKSSTDNDGEALLPSPSISEWVSTYLGLSDVLNKLQSTHEASMVMQDAVAQFAGTPDEARITTANAELLIARGNAKEALNLLSKVTEDKPFYIQAMERMADIYLKHDGNKSKYIACYKELAEKLPGPPTTQLLGDAYMNIQELDMAIELFEAAIRKSPKDGVLASKIGQAYLKAHSYSKAIQYYENSLRTNDTFAMRYELGCVYLRLKQFDKAEKTISKGIDQTAEKRESDSAPGLVKELVQYHLLMTKIYQAKGMTDDYLNHLEAARTVQTQLVRRAKTNRATKETKQLIDIILKVAEHFQLMPDCAPKAEECYTDVLEMDEDSTEARISLIKLYLSSGDTQRSEEHCLKLLRSDDNENNSSALLMAELLILKDNLEGAAKHMEDILMKHPDNTECLTKLINVKRRMGDLKSVQYYITQAESHSAKSVYEPALVYCKGLYCRYMGQSDEALILFNQIKNTPLCGEDALFNMVEICLLNEDNILGMESLKSTEIDQNLMDSEAMAIRTAEKLLKELNPVKPSSVLQKMVLENFLLLLSKNRGTAERVMANTQELSPVERESAPVLVLTATAFLLMKQVPRARNQLKRLSKLSWTVQNADYLEKGWILLADVYMQSGKYDLAIEQLKRCLKYNKSCSKASECLGFIAEKEHSYQDAANHYENAWRHGHMTNPVVGYRLAFNYLKAQHNTRAVDVCHQVLDKHPTYPRIKKDILDKARSAIRM